TLRVRSIESASPRQPIPALVQDERLSRSRALQVGRAGGTPGATTWAWLAALVFALSTWTILIASTRVVRFNVLWPRARPRIETTGMVVAALTAGLGYLRYSLSRSPSSLFLALAFT